MADLGGGAVFFERSTPVGLVLGNMISLGAVAVLHFEDAWYPYLTQGVLVVLQMSILPQIRQLILHYY